MQSIEDGISVNMEVMILNWAKFLSSLPVSPTSCMIPSPWTLTTLSIWDKAMTMRLNWRIIWRSLGLWLTAKTQASTSKISWSAYRTFPSQVCSKETIQRNLPSKLSLRRLRTTILSLTSRLVSLDSPRPTKKWGKKCSSTLLKLRS